MAGIFPNSWTETALVTIQLKGGTARQFSAITETIDISEPDYPGESLMMIGGARIWKQSGQEDGEVTIELYPINIASNANNTGLFQQFAGGTQDTSQPLATDIAWPEGIDRPRDRYIIGIMWTSDTAQISALSATTAADFTAIRFYAKECRITSHKADFTDGILKVTVTFKFPAMDAAGTARSYQWESSDDTDTSPLPAISYS